MAMSNELPECVICNEPLADPRPLPCGHSYCGPPRPCLKSMEVSERLLRCAVCRVGHKLRAADIKPLYGIREYFKDSSRQKEKTLYIPCSLHQDKECSNWCSSCSLIICDICFDDEHDGHAVRKLKRYLTEKVESMFGSPLLEGMGEYQETLKQLIELRSSEIEQLQAPVKAVENELLSAQQQKQLIDDFVNFYTTEIPQKLEVETYWLLNVSRVDKVSLKASRFTDRYREMKDAISSSTQTEDSIKKTKNSAVQTDAIANSISKNDKGSEVSVQTIDAKKKTKNSVVQTDAISNSISKNDKVSEVSVQTIDAKKKTKNSVVQTDAISTFISKNDKGSQVSGRLAAKILSIREGYFPESTSCDSIQGRVSVEVQTSSELCTKTQKCSCACQDKNTLGPLFTIPVLLVVEILILNRNPFKAITSDGCLVPPYLFWMDPELAPNPLNRSEKKLRITVGCRRADGDLSALPSFTFKYRFVLQNFEKRALQKEKTGDWKYPQDKTLEWDCVNYSDLVNPQRNWMREDNCIIIQLELKR